jgi:hypothetical protein
MDSPDEIWLCQCDLIVLRAIWLMRNDMIFMKQDWRDVKE